MDGKITQEALIVCLQAALEDSEYSTTVAVGMNRALTFGPPRFRDRSVSRYCESDYNDPREVYIQREKQLKWVCYSDPYGTKWIDESDTPWAYYERRLVQQADGSVVDVLAPMISRVHWLYQAKF